MDAKAFVDKFGKEEAERVAIAAGISYEYFMQFARKTRRPSIPLAYRLVEESERRLTFVELLPRELVT